MVSLVGYIMLVNNKLYIELFIKRNVTFHRFSANVSSFLLLFHIWWNNVIVGITTGKRYRYKYILIRTIPCVFVYFKRYDVANRHEEHHPVGHGLGNGRTSEISKNLLYQKNIIAISILDIGSMVRLVEWLKFDWYIIDR